MFGIKGGQRERKRQYKADELKQGVNQQLDKEEAGLANPAPKSVGKKNKPMSAESKALEAGRQERKTKKGISEQKENAAKEAKQKEANRLAQEAEANTAAGRAAGTKRYEEIQAAHHQGLTDKERQAYEGKNRRDVSRQMQGIERKLAAQHSRKGIRGGAAYAQQADLARAGLDARQEYSRDLDIMDQDRKLKNIAAQIALEESHGMQNLLNQRISSDKAQAEEDRRRNKNIEDALLELQFGRKRR